MNDSQKQHIDDSGNSQTIRIELPLEALRRMMASFIRPSVSEAGCCEATIHQCCRDSHPKHRYEFTVRVERKE